MEFKSYSFKDLLENIVDNRGKTCPVQSSGIPLIATNCIKDNSLYAEYERVRYVSEETYKTWFRGHPEPEDIIFVCKGSPGRVAWVQNPVSYCIAQDMVAIRANKSVIDSKFLFALLRSPKAQKSILNMHVGTMIPHFKKGDFSKLYFDIPSDLEYQKWAGEVYFNFSEKIELNKQTNQTLEQMAQALFKSWFVDFDPVFDNLLASADFKLQNLENRLPDKLKQKAQRRLAALNSLENAAECKASLIALAHELQAQTQAAEQVSEKAAETPVKPDFSANPNILAQHANTHAHFPNEFDHNEQLGWIPKSWEAGCLEDMLVLQRGFDLPKSKRTNGDYPLIVSSGQDGTHSEFKARGPGVVTGRSGKIGIITFVHDDFWPLNTTLWIKEYRKSNPYHAFHLLSTLGLEQFNSGSAVPTLNRNHIHSLPLVVPTTLVLNEYESYVEDLFLKIRKNNIQSNTLKNLRDTLLPKLISGELQIPDSANVSDSKI